MRKIHLIFSLICLGWSMITPSFGSNGAEIYQQHCAMCHASGISGAPKMGDLAAWKALGSDTQQQVQVVIEGKGAMPPNGSCDACTEADLTAAVEYMKK